MFTDFKRPGGVLNSSFIFYNSSRRFLYVNIAVQDINKALPNSYGNYISLYMALVGGGGIPLTTLTIAPTVLYLNICNCRRHN